ncbi:MAG: ATP-binding protein, partial [Anaerolineaceae bacterium]|nr:ATP-binding protein [Anaerolineaceae bacterium]
VSTNLTTDSNSNLEDQNQKTYINGDTSKSQKGEFRFEIGDQLFLAKSYLLDDPDLTVEIAMNISEIAKTQQQLIRFLIVGISVVAIIASIIGGGIARRISHPIEQLASRPTSDSMELLYNPIEVTTQIKEINVLTKVLEKNRIRLLDTLVSLQKEKEWSEHLLESIVEGIVAFDKNKKIIYFSSGAERITGRLVDQVINQHIDDIFTLTDDQSSFHLQIPPPGKKKEISILLAGNKPTTLSITRARLSPTSTNNASVAVFFRDVSDEEILNQLMGHFMGNIIHEFRTPLSALAASIELLMDEPDNLSKEELHELINTLHLGILGLGTLIDNLLEGASIETGNFSVSPHPHDLYTIIREAASTMDPLLEKYGQDLSLDLPKKLPPVWADSRRVIQVLVNLLSNASRYGPNDEAISLSAKVIQDWVEISIIDRGPGIPQKYRQKLFSGFIFTSVEDGLIKKGAGLGLSVVKEIVDAHGGQVGVKDNPNGGSIFWFTLPIVNDK